MSLNIKTGVRINDIIIIINFDQIIDLTQGNLRRWSHQLFCHESGQHINQILGPYPVRFRFPLVNSPAPIMITPSNIVHHAIVVFSAHGFDELYYSRRKNEQRKCNYSSDCSNAIRHASCRRFHGEWASVIIAIGADDWYCC